MEDVEKVLSRVIETRKKRGLSQENMALELGISQAAYTNMENNESKLTVERLLKVAQILKKPVYYFFEVSPQKINNVNNYDSSVGYLQDFENLYQDNKETYEKLEASYKESIENLKQEAIFLRKLIEADK